MEKSVGGVLLVNCSSFLSSDDIIREMFNNKRPEPKHISDCLNAYLWQIENKYYTADIHLCTCSVTSPPRNHECGFAENLFFQSIIIVFDENESSFTIVKSWLSYVESQDPSVLLLLNSGKGGGGDGGSTSYVPAAGADTRAAIWSRSDLREVGPFATACGSVDPHFERLPVARTSLDATEGGISKADVVRWCLANSFELIEMMTTAEEDHQEDYFGEKTGIARVIEALQCAEWPNMKMKESPRLKVSTYLTGNHGTADVSIRAGSAQLGSDTSKLSDTSKTPVFPLPSDDLELPSGSASDGNEIESFEDLFQNLGLMKERASCLPSKERKDYAEKVRTSSFLVPQL
ncbi:alpha- and gamma-adaptin-binding protein p34-like isoform X2 [Montipora foliosa]|uniref:alpha- and gamma-adaptin-binding protein p34-like isoform X2 n=1 Tax=Montipora foliosa TaxID=591990 RepID=UPI0035F1EB0C